MQTENKEIDFRNKTIYAGIDVHKTKWVVTLRMEHLELKTFSMEPSVEGLVGHLKKRYPGASYSSGYEAGQSGFWIDRQLKRLGVANMIVNPADIPTTGREKDKKNDYRDSRKLARELENHTMRGIYVPCESQEALRSLCRIRSQFVGEKARLKNRIKCFLAYYGKPFPGKNTRQWSERLLTTVGEIRYPSSISNECMGLYLDQIVLLQQKVKAIEQMIKEKAEELGVLRTVERLQTIPGIGFVSAITIYTELSDITRFQKLDQLCSYIGLVPSTSSSGEKERVKGISLRQKKYLKSIIIEASWMALRKDPALTLSYSHLLSRMQSQKAIIKIAKKVLNRIRYVWIHDTDYQLSVVR